MRILGAMLGGTISSYNVSGTIKLGGPSCIRDMLTEEFHCLSEEKDLFELSRLEDINELNAQFPNVERVKLVAADGATNYMRECVDAMDDETFAKWIEYHFAVCERQDLIGASHHTLDILRRL